MEKMDAEYCEAMAREVAYLRALLAAKEARTLHTQGMTGLGGSHEHRSYPVLLKREVLDLLDDRSRQWRQAADEVRKETKS